jgi:hypothetical protein
MDARDKERQKKSLAVLAPHTTSVSYEQPARTAWAVGRSGTPVKGSRVLINAAIINLLYTAVLNLEEIEVNNLIKYYTILFFVCRVRK